MEATLRQMFWNTLPADRRRRPTKLERLGRAIHIAGVAYIGGIALLMYLLKGNPVGGVLVSFLGIVGWFAIVVMGIFYFRLRRASDRKGPDREAR